MAAYFSDCGVAKWAESEPYYLRALELTPNDGRLLFE
tara:strand:- start:9368 stop:9478 length:111 start_codon:yes stop_codon:yes gene_type:complete